MANNILIWECSVKYIFFLFFLIQQERVKKNRKPFMHWTRCHGNTTLPVPRELLSFSNTEMDARLLTAVLELSAPSFTSVHFSTIQSSLQTYPLFWPLHKNNIYNCVVIKVEIYLNKKMQTGRTFNAEQTCLFFIKVTYLPVCTEHWAGEILTPITSN